MSQTNKQFTGQEAVNPAYRAVAFGGTAIAFTRAVHSNVDRSFKVTMRDGTRVIMAYLAGLDYGHSITSVSTTAGSAISSASSLIIGLY